MKYYFVILYFRKKTIYIYKMTVPGDDWKPPRVTLQTSMVHTVY